jgi:c-di-GMP-binding flagellar brake protein YcgR
MMLTGLEQFAEGRLLRFELALSDSEPPICGSARVVRAHGGGRCGVVFEDISSTERQRLIHFIFNRQRAARAKTRDGARAKRRVR